MRPKKSLGQNFLNDTNILNKIVETAEITTKDIVLEIGPGTGNLTKELIKKKPSQIIVVEKDKKLSELLTKKFGKNIKIINDDILNCYNKLDFDVPIKVFGNLPYYISTKILTSYLKIGNINQSYKSFHFVFQKEVADRIVAKINTNNYGRLSILTSWRMDCNKKFDISPKSFFPVPKVWSSLVVLTPKINYSHIKKSKNLEHITNIFFNQRRKMIKQPLKQIFKNYLEVSEKLELNLNLRPQNLSVNDYLEICKLYEKLT